MKGRPFLIAAICCALVFVLTLYWWPTTSDEGHLQSLSNLLVPLKPISHADTFAVRDKVATILETRPLRTLIPLILHFAAVLGPEWPIIFMTRASTLHALEAFGGGSQPFKRIVESGQVKIIDLPSESYLKSYLGISHFLASEWFWEQLEPAQIMLLFQTDSIICANSGKSVEDFFGYDFIGAAHPFIPNAFNGGLSLRNVSLSRQIVQESSIADDVVNGTELGLFEDAWFCDKMEKLGGRFPSRERASEFVVDFEWAERPLAYHGVNKGQHDDRLEEIYAWCPEAVLAAEQAIVGLTKEEQKRNSSSTKEIAQSDGGHLLSFG